MNFLDKVSKQLPSLALISVVFSTFYNVGFLNAVASPDLITNLNYQDILNSSIFVLAALIPIYSLLSWIFNGLNVDIKDFSIFQIILFLSIFTLIGTWLFLYPAEQFAWLIFIVFLCPIIYWIFEKIDIQLEKDSIKSIAVAVAISITCFTYGISSVNSIDCFGTRYLKTEECPDCLILKIYSDFIILRRIEGSVSILPNTHDYEIEIRLPNYQAKLNDSKCNPTIGIQKWFASMDL
jgi:hypothetical protein